MKLTVIIPCYKFVKFIEQSVMSAVNQKTTFDFEILVRDDGSGDGTYEILQNLAKNHNRIRVLDSSENLGNKGYNNIKLLLHEAKGEYISYLDGDDFITDEYKLQKQVDFLEQNSDYVLHSVGAYSVDAEGNDLIGDWRWLTPIIKEVELKHIIKSNFISWGRTFRNIPHLLEDWFIDSPFIDWMTNYKLLKYGKAMCEDWPGGCYRNHGGGTITSLSQSEIERLNEQTRVLIQKDLNKKVVLIVSTHIKDSKTAEIVSNCIESLKKTNFDILLVSNSLVPQNILEGVNHWLYSKDAKLFNGSYTNVWGVDLWETNDHFTKHEIVPGIQRHGLAVLVNLFRALDLAKSMGYTHFIRVEGDNLLGDKSIDFLNRIPRFVTEQGKSGLFYTNENHHTDPNNISMHVFYSEIDYFLKKVTRINEEQDFIDYLKRERQSADFQIVEEFLWDNLFKKSDDQSLIKRDGVSDIVIDFPDSKFNQVISNFNRHQKYHKVQTQLFRDDSNSSVSVVLSKNHTELTQKRFVKVFLKSGEEIETEHTLSFLGAWSYNTFIDVERIEVFDENRIFLYKEVNQNIESYIKFN